jgi:hypothetical protein
VVECDIVLDGPCRCGATHTREEFWWRCGPNVWNVMVKRCKEVGVIIPGDIYPDSYVINRKEF